MPQTATAEAAYSLSAEYTAPEDEWRALLTLAAKDDPARAIAASGWKANLFATHGAREAYERLAESSHPLTLTPPPEFADVAATGDRGQLLALHDRLSAWAQWRKIADVQENLGAQTLAMLNAKGGEQEAELLKGGRPLVESALAALGKVDSLGRGSGAPETVTLGVLADPDGFWARVADARDATPTGLGGLDKLLGGGFQAKRLMVLLGGPGGGKSTLSNQIAEHIADAGRPVLYMTLEDSAAVMLSRTVARLGDVDYGAVLTGREACRGAIERTLRQIAGRRSAQRLLYVEDAPGGRPIHPETLRDLAAEHFAKFSRDGRGLLVVDYLQRWARSLRMLPEHERRELRERVGWLTERLRQLARELDCSVLCIASQNRASGYGNGGGDALATAKESGDVEYSADVVMALGRPVERDQRTPPLHCEPRVLRVDKNRQGPTAAIPLDLDWRGDRQSFTEAAP